jgi:hypothetical protein
MTRLTGGAGAWHRQGMGPFPRLASLFALLLACGCSSTPKEEPKTPGDQPEGDTTTEATAGLAADQATSDPGPAPGGVKRTEADGSDSSVPDDYSLVERDCVLLGEKLGSLWQTDLRATLSPKLSEKQRAQAEESIQEGASKKADDWANGCIKSLVGKSVDPKALKCAFNSRDLKAFETCLN